MTYSCARLRAAATTAGRRPAPQVRRRSRPGRRRPGDARARDRHRLGRHGDPRRPRAGRAASPPRRISRQQLDLAARRVARGRPGRPGRRPAAATTADSQGRYDAIVSIEMFEAVGERYWPAFFADLRPAAAAGRRRRRCRRSPCRTALPGDRAARYTWIHKYVFPGGADPVRQAIDAAMARASRAAGDRRRARSACTTRETLRDWRERFLARRRRGARARASTTPSCGCGSSTSPTARPASRPARSATPSCGWSARVRYAGAPSSGSPGPRAGSARPWPASWPAAAPASRSPLAAADRLERVAGGPDAGRAGRRHRPGRDARRGRAGRGGAGPRSTWPSSNAGDVAADGRRARGTRELFRRHFDTNLMGIVHGIDAVLPGMRRRRERRDRRHRQRRRLPRLAQLRGLRRDQGGGDQPAGVAAHRSAAARASGCSPSAPGSCAATLTDANTFPMPFLIEADDAAPPDRRRHRQARRPRSSSRCR